MSRLNALLLGNDMLDLTIYAVSRPRERFRFRVSLDGVEVPASYGRGYLYVGDQVSGESAEEVFAAVEEMLSATSVIRVHGARFEWDGEAWESVCPACDGTGWEKTCGHSGPCPCAEEVCGECKK